MENENGKGAVGAIGDVDGGELVMVRNGEGEGAEKGEAVGAGDICATGPEDTSIVVIDVGDDGVTMGLPGDNGAESVTVDLGV